MSKSSSKTAGAGKSAWEKAAEDFKAGKVSQAWFYQGDDLSLILKGHRIESASLSDDSMATIVLDGGLMVQVYAGGYLADTSVRLGRISVSSDEIIEVDESRVAMSGGGLLTQVYAHVPGEDSWMDELLFEVLDVDGGRPSGGRMFFGVAFRAPSASEHAVGADR